MMMMIRKKEKKTLSLPFIIYLQRWVESEGSDYTLFWPYCSRVRPPLGVGQFVPGKFFFGVFDYLFAVGV